MQSTYLWVWVGFGVAVAAAVLYGAYRTVPSLYWKILVCMVPIIGSTLIVGRAVMLYNAGEGGFKLGVDLVGGTRLIYEIDPSRTLPESFKIEQLVTSLKKRIDPADLYNITIRPAGERRVEIVLPTGGAHQARLAEEAWRAVLEKIEGKYKNELDGEKIDSSTEVWPPGNCPLEEETFECIETACPGVTFGPRLRLRHNTVQNRYPPSDQVRGHAIAEYASGVRSAWCDHRLRRAAAAD